ncbi:hypothetical protein D9Q98_005272 [Chlorella vulgaris]|uniref:Protein kinase domain-containing protein n=1 Tax=Chlorella vulgaris TaxID=3077 RepID=A0A9D4TP52_CHLVU|nr:hypothetical protein D9Q98_005272 [Chlorella vulgaris]
MPCRDDFAIKAVPAQQSAAANPAARAARPAVVQINVSAGATASQLHTRSACAPALRQKVETRPLPWHAGVVGVSICKQQPPGDATALPPLPGYRNMAQFTRLQELYKSSACSVFQARCLAGGGDVIIKRYSKGKMSSRAVHKMQREIKLMYHLRGQAGVAQILGDFADAAHFYIAMEFYTGGDLYKRYLKQAKEGPLNEQWICSKVIIPLLHVLCALHASNVVHRDIKPENIFLTDCDELRLGDFGLAIEQRQELPFLRAGTLDYMAPEVDVWAVGVLAYELMSGGATPFFHDKEEQTQKLIMRCDLAAVHFERHQLLSPWADFVRTALQREPAQRPTAAQLLQHRWLQQHLQKPLRPLLVPQRRPDLSRANSLPVLCVVTAPPAAPGAAAPAQASAAPLLVPTASTASTLASKLLGMSGTVHSGSSSGSGSGGGGASVLVKLPSSTTAGSGGSSGMSTLAGSLATLSRLAECSGAAHDSWAVPPPQPSMAGTEASAAASCASCLTLTALPGCQCSACRLGEDSCRLQGCASDSGVMVDSGEDWEMPLAAPELSAADPGSFAAPASGWDASQGAMLVSAHTDARVPGLSCVAAPAPALASLLPSPFASHPARPPLRATHSLPILAGMECNRPAAFTAAPPPPSRLGPAHASPLAEAPSSPVRVTADAQQCMLEPSAEAGGSGLMRLSRAGQRNRMMAYMQKQRVSLLHTLRISRRLGSDGRSHASNSRSGGSSSGIGSASSSEDGSGPAAPAGW